MAQIDLKFAEIEIVDGYALAGQVNNPGNYAAGVTTIAVSGVVGAVSNGDTFTITGETGTPTHTVTGHVENGGGNTVQVTFSTVIATGGVSNASTVTFKKTGAVNGAGTAGDTTLTIDTLVGIVQNGDTFLIAGETGTPTHTVTGHVETSGNTTGVTFSTVLASGGAADNAVITFTRASGAATVNGAAGYQAGASTMVVDGFTAALVTGETFTVAGETGLPVHTITGHSETGPGTTSVTFTPVLAGAVADNAVLTLLPHSLTLFIGDGTLEYTEHRNIDYKLNQGLLKYTRLGDQQPMDANFDFVWEFLSSAGSDIIPTPEEAFKRIGLASAWVSTGIDPCEPYAVDIRVKYTPPCGNVEKETITLQYFRYEELQHSFKNAQISVKGKCMAQQAEAVRS